MEFEASSSSLFLILILVTLLILLYLMFKPSNPWCNCQTCRSYLTLSWTKDHVNLCDWYSHLLRNSPTKTIHIHVLRNTITANPDNVEYMLKTKFDNFPKGKPFSAILGDFLGRGIFNVDGDSWLFQRKMASPELDGLSVRSFAFEIVNSEIENRLIPLFQSVSCKNRGSVLDLQDVFKRFSFDSICRFSLGLDPMCLELSLPMSEFARCFDLASNLSAKRAMRASPMVWKAKRLLNLGSERQLKEAIRMIDVLAREMINQKRKVGFEDQQDLLSRFMRTVNDDIYLRDIIVSFLLAGRDTVASALTSFFWLLVNHPQVELKIRKEADQVVGDQRLTSFEQMKDLHYLNASVYESMRLYPPIQFDSKFCLKDDVLPDGTFVKSGTRVTYHPYAMGRIEEIWGPDCVEFKPDRWIKNGVFSPVNQFKYPVFQAGLRVCLGKEMALLELRTVALAILQRFHIELAAPTDPVPRFSPGLTATISGGLRVLVQEVAR